MVMLLIRNAKECLVVCIKECDRRRGRGRVEKFGMIEEKGSTQQGRSMPNVGMRAMLI
jgi:hypothetical protein